YGTATIHEAMGRVGLMRPYMRPVYDGAKLCGPAVTVLLQPGDNWMLHVAAEQLQDGDVVVAGCITESDAGSFGDYRAPASPLAAEPVCLLTAVDAIPPNCRRWIFPSLLEQSMHAEPSRKP